MIIIEWDAFRRGFHIALENVSAGGSEVGDKMDLHEDNVEKNYDDRH